MELGAAVGSLDLSYEFRHKLLVVRISCFFNKCSVHHLLQAAEGSIRQLQDLNGVQPTFEVKSQNTSCRTVISASSLIEQTYQGRARRPEYTYSICELAFLRSRICNLRSGQNSLGCNFQDLELLPSHASCARARARARLAAQTKAEIMCNRTFVCGEGVGEGKQAMFAETARPQTPDHTNCESGTAANSCLRCSMKRHGRQPPCTMLQMRHLFTPFCQSGPTAMD